MNGDVVSFVYEALNTFDRNVFVKALVADSRRDDFPQSVFQRLGHDGCLLKFRAPPRLIYRGKGQSAARSVSPSPVNPMEEGRRPLSHQLSCFYTFATPLTSA